MASLLTFLERKWRSQEDRLKQSLVEKEEEGERREDELGQLVLMPVRGAVIKAEEEVVVTKVERPKVKIKLSGFDDCEPGCHVQEGEEESGKFEELLGLQRGKRETDGEQASPERPDPLSNCEDSNDAPGRSGGEETVPQSPVMEEEEAVPQSPRLEEEEGVGQSPRCEEEEENEQDQDYLDLSDPECSRSPGPDMEDVDYLEELEEEEDGVKEEEEAVKADVKEELEEDGGEGKKWGDPREGWGRAEAEGLTMADLYILLGGREEGATLKLDYCWRREEGEGESRAQCTSLLSRLVRLAAGSVRAPRGRSTSQSSPSVRGSSLLSPQTAARSPMASTARSPMARGGLLLSPIGKWGYCHGEVN